ncbi:MAG: transcription antitermination factor NusB [Gammaproteobacteria bacterium]|nr:transcription antitermination factor NusB [Gammaproteobacteria bacterium]
MSKPPSITRSRHKARNLAVQALYQWQITGQDRDDIVSKFLTDQEMNETVTEYFKELVSKVSANAASIDDALSPLLDRPIEQLDPVESAVLRIGAYELQHRPDVPYKVVINEAIEAAKLFGAEESYKYINGVLDKLKGKYRAQEIEHAKTV